jgi:hypothetical protein
VSIVERFDVSALDPRPPAAVSLREAGNPCVFIVGCLRSGTSVFQRIVDAHRALSIVPETEWVPQGFERRKHREQRDLRASGMSREVWVGPELLDEVLAHPRFSRLKLDRADLAEWMRTDRQVRYADFVRGVFEAHGRHAGTTLVGEKSPGYVRHLPTLHFLWPRARVVHLIRDGRDVCVSLLAWKPPKQDRTIGRFSTWAEEPLITAGLWWEWHVRLGLEARPRLADALLEVRYEALVTRPEDECRAVCTFLGLDYDDQMLRFFERAPLAGRTAREGRGPAAPLRPETCSTSWAMDAA